MRRFLFFWFLVVGVVGVVWLVLQISAWRSVPIVRTTAPLPLELTTAGGIEIFEPIGGASVASPLVVRGRARGTWYFEASFPVRLEDTSGVVLASAPAQAQSDWMTEDFVPFETTLTWISAPATDTGVLVLSRDNPSGDPVRDASIRVSVRF